VDSNQDYNTDIERWIEETLYCSTGGIYRSEEFCDERRASKKICLDLSAAMSAGDEQDIQGVALGLKRIRPITPEKSDTVENAIDWDDATPKSRFGVRIQTTMTAQGIGWARGLQGSSESGVSSSADSKSTTSSKSRSTSPRKKARDAYHPPHLMRVLSWAAFGTSGIQWSDAVLKLVRELKEIEDREGEFVPRPIYDIAAGAGSYAEVRGRFIRECASPVSGQFSDQELWTRIEEIIQATIECRDEDCSEAEWNDEVHSRLLRLALGNTWKNAGVWYRNTTAASIDDEKFCKATKARQVDFCITIGNTRSARERVEAYIEQVGRISINHTSANYLKLTPIAVSIETKKERSDEGGAMQQLGTWVAAQFALLRFLVGEGGALPPLILVTVQGHEWKVMVATSTGVPREHGVIFRDISIGESDTLLGVCRILQGLRRIAGYIIEEYEPWFLREVLRDV
jgi:hypothetical protein